MKTAIFSFTIVLVLFVLSCKKPSVTKPSTPHSTGLAGNWSLYETMISPGNSVPWTRVPAGSENVSFTTDGHFSGSSFNSGKYHILDSIRMQLDPSPGTSGVYYYHLRKDTLVMSYSGCIEACALKFIFAP